MNAQLALALLAVGPVKTGLAPTAAVPTPQPKGAAVPSNDARDPIAFLAREWLKKR